MLLHIADGSNPAVYQQIRSVYDVLEEIGIEEKDALLVINKVDQIADTHQLDLIMNRYPNAVSISAVTREGFQSLAMAVSDALSRSFLDLMVETGIENGRLMAFIAARGEILSTRYTETRVVIHCRLPEKYAGQIDRQTATVVPRQEYIAESQSVIQPSE